MEDSAKERNNSSGNRNSTFGVIVFRVITYGVIVVLEDLGCFGRLRNPKKHMSKMPPLQPTPSVGSKGKQKLAPPLNKKTSRSSASFAFPVNMAWNPKYWMVMAVGSIVEQIDRLID